MIQYVIGDATRPIGEGMKIIAHVCNDIGAWGAGFVLALSRRWEAPERIYRDWEPHRRVLGAIQVTKVEQDILVANMVAQHGVQGTKSRPPIRYYALLAALHKLSQFAEYHKASVHMPRIGCGLAGGQWYRVESLLWDTLLDRGIEVFVYDLSEEDRKHFLETPHHTGIYPEEKEKKRKEGGK